jgi:hypothetical protein
VSRHMIAAACAIVAANPMAHAMDLATGDPETKLRLDFTPKYSAARRLHNPSPALSRLDVGIDPGIANEDDGNHNFKRGLISSRFDLLAELDYSAPKYGFRVSGAAWRDAVYLRPNSYRGTPVFVNGVQTPAVVSTANNNPGQAPNEFLPFTRRLHGRDGELLDAFVYLKGDVAGMPAHVRIGKHSVQWGEAVFFGQNGIVNAQGPVDIVKILSVPDFQFKEVVLPVEQISGSLELEQGLTLSGYYQLKWRGSKLPGTGSYFSDSDAINTGGVDFGPSDPTNPASPHVVLPENRGLEHKPRNSGQGGIQLRWRPQDLDYEFGFYAVQYHDKVLAAPVFDFARGAVYQAYAENIRSIGASASTTLAGVSWATEASYRWNAPLTSNPVLLGLPGGPATCGTKSAPCYAVGQTAHVNFSGLYVGRKTALWDGVTVLGELAYARRVKVDKDIFAPALGETGMGGGLAGNTTPGAFAFRMLISPQYYQVLPGLDVSVPISVGYNFGGRSSAIFKFGNTGTSQAGDFSIGLNAKYQNAWNVSLNYTDYFGKAASLTRTLVPGQGAPRELTFGQTLKDRAFVSLSVSRTF